MTMPCFLRRLIEIFVVNIVLSLPFGIMSEMGKLPNSYSATVFLLLLCALLTIAVNVYMLRSYYCFVKNRFDYFTVNIPAYLIFFAVSMVIYKFCQGGYLPWSAFTAPYFMYRAFECLRIPTLYSALMVHFAMIVIICGAPLEMYRVMDVMRTISKNDEN